MTHEAKAGGETTEYVTFYLDREPFAFPLSSVREIIRVPETVAVPLTPPSLLGLANLRGLVLPILDLRGLLGLERTASTDASRVIVVDFGTQIGLVVDRVERVVRVPEDRIEDASSLDGGVSSDFMTGVVKDSAGYSLLQLLDAKRIIELEFEKSAVGQQITTSVGHSTGDLGTRLGETAAADDRRQFVTFVLSGEEYAIEIGEVKEIVRVPEGITSIPRSQSHVLGLMNLRDRLLGLVKLRRLFDLPEDQTTERHRIVVATPNGREDQSVGLVVDEVREVLSVDAAQIEALPPLLSSRGRSETTGVCRLNDGKRLISLLSADKLFDREAVREAIAAATADLPVSEPSDVALAKPEGGTEVVDERTRADQLEDDTGEIQLVVFNLGKEEYGAPIHSVSEIIRVPEQMTRLPRTPDFIEGIINLRGKVLPVIDLRVRFGLPRPDRSDRQRILVLEIDGVFTGFIVDSVSEVLRVQRSFIEASPHMSDEQARIMGRVVNLKDAKRMILVMEIDELLDSDEVAAMESTRAA